MSISSNSINSTSHEMDARLLFKICAGDQSAFKALISRYHSAFLAMALASSLSRADCDEVVSDAFVKIWHGAGNYRDVGVEPKYWLRTVMRRALVDKFRLVQRYAPEQSATQTDLDGDFLVDDYGESSSEPDQYANTPVVALESKQADACFDDCLFTLSEVQRDTLQRCLLAGQSELVIAVETKQSLGTVKSRKHYAIKKMQLCVRSCLNSARDNT